MGLRITLRRIRRYTDLSPGGRRGMINSVFGTEPAQRTAWLEWYRRTRERSRALFNLISDEAYYSQPIALRHPIVFYEGHLPGFSFNTLVTKALGRAGIDARLESLFARGIDPHESASGSGGSGGSGTSGRS